MKSYRFIIALFVTLGSLSASATDHGLKTVVSLPKLLQLFMLGSSERPSWEMGAGASGTEVLWISTGIEPSSACGRYEACRKGYVRVTVRGGEIQHLRKRLEPIEWDLFMASTGLAKFGPDRIEISPKCDTVSCDFDFHGSLVGSAIVLTQVCEAGPAPSHVTAFNAKAGGKHSYVILNENLGSGGKSITLTVTFDKQTAETACYEAKVNK